MEHQDIKQIYSQGVGKNHRERETGHIWLRARILLVWEGMVLLAKVGQVLMIQTSISICHPGLQL